MKVFALKVAYYYPDADYRNQLETFVRLYVDKGVAIKCLEHEIRSGWTCEVEAEGGVAALADCRGQSETGEENDKYASWNYSEDGTLAWCFFSDGHGYKGEVVELEFGEAS